MASQSGANITVPVSTIDHYCFLKNIPKISLLKLDIEGHELKALQGAKKLISENKIDFVSFEFGSANIDSRTYFKDYYYFFIEKGYNLYQITPSGTLYKFTQHKESLEQFRTGNYLAQRIQV